MSRCKLFTRKWLWKTSFETIDTRHVPSPLRKERWRRMRQDGVVRQLHAVNEIDRLFLCSFFAAHLVICCQGSYRPETPRRPVITACWTTSPHCTGSPTTSGRSAAIRHRWRWWVTASARPPSTCWLCRQPLKVSRTWIELLCDSD